MLAPALVLVAHTASCGGIGLYGELNAGWMDAEITSRGKNSARAAESAVTTFGFSFGAEFEFAFLSTLSLGYTSQGAAFAADKDATTLRDIDLTATSTIAALRPASGWLLPRAGISVLWNNDSSRTYLAMAGLGATLVARNWSWTLLAGPTLARWELDVNRYSATGAMARLRGTWFSDRKTRSR